nr:hypothetical protein [uncultured Janthinobacterium sp.]
MVNEVAKCLIFQRFPRYSVADTLKNTLIAKSVIVGLSLEDMGKTSPLARTCHQSLIGDENLVKRHLPQTETAKAEIVYEWKTCHRAKSSRIHLLENPTCYA